MVLLFIGVEALATADQGTVGAVAPQLEQSFHITNGQVGLIAGIAALAGAFGTVPVGMLSDRIHRIHLLAASILLWSAAMVAGALAPSFLVLVLTRLALGAVTATSGPTIASLTGDYFAPGERAKMWGLILTGEVIGAGIGLVVSGNLAVVSWRYGFAWLAIPGALLALAIWLLLDEPARGGHSRVEESGATLEDEQELAQQAVREHDVDPDPNLVLHTDPVDMPLGRAVRYVLRVRTNVVLIIANAVGFMFFAGVQTFAVLLLRSRYGLSQSVATSLRVVVGLGAMAGIVLAGRLADRRLRSGKVNARVEVGAAGYMLAAVLFVPALASPALAVSLPLFVVGAGALAAPDPTLNAARLDIMHPRLWGRAEGVRTVLQLLALALGPLLFGVLSGALGGPRTSIGPAGAVKHTSALAYTFLIMLVPVAIAGMILLRARRTYPSDVATATASIVATEHDADTASVSVKAPVDRRTRARLRSAG